MLYPHAIRLRGPWELAIDDQPWADERVTLPDGLPRVLEAHAGRKLRLRRWFNLPTNLEAHEQVWLVIEPPPADIAATLNQQPVLLDRIGSHLEAVVTALLTDRNELVIGVQSNTPFDVRLEIRNEPRGVGR